MKKDITVSLEASGYDLLLHVAAIVAAIKAAGPLNAAAIPADLSALIVNLQPMIADVAAIPAELAEDKLSVAKGAMLGAWSVVEAALAK